MRKTITENGEVLYRVPIIVNEETIGEIGNEREDIHYELIGNRKWPVKYVWATEDDYHVMMREQWAEVKAMERASRCLCPNGKGGFTRCPETNKCYGCIKSGHYDFDNNHITSLERLPEDYESKSLWYEMECNLETLELSKFLVTELSKINDRYSRIFRVMLDGILRPYHISKETGIPNSTVAKDIPIIRELAQKLYHKF